VELSSINPTQATDPNDAKLCPTAPGQTHCSGQISSVIAPFDKYVNKKNPIRITIIARWGSSIPPGHILMEKNTGGDPIFLPACVVNSTTREFNVPCVLPQIVHGTAAANNLTTYNTILLTGDDVHFARRTATGGTKVAPPAAPTALTATPGVGKAVLKWKAPTVTNGAGVTGYVATVLSAGKVVKTVAYNTAALTQTITGLTKGVGYTFKVAAKNVAGTGVAGAASAAIKPIGTPAAPTVVTATAGAARATAKWKAPTVIYGAAITGYVVTVLQAGVVVKTVTYTTAALTQTVTGLTKGKSYTFKVQAKNVAGAGAASAPSNAVVPT
jgi:titin